MQGWGADAGRMETSLGLRDSLRKTHREERYREVQRDPGEIKEIQTGRGSEKYRERERERERERGTRQQDL